MKQENSILPAIVAAIQDKKGSAITIINLEKLGVATTSTFIICQGKTPTQVSAIADNIEEQVRKEEGRKPLAIDGTRNSQWVVIDYGEVMVHVFVPEFRDRYRLEELWNDAPVTLIPDLD